MWHITIPRSRSALWVALGDEVSSSHSSDRVPENLIWMRRQLLHEAIRDRRLTHSRWASDGVSPGTLTVGLDIEVLIADDAPTARIRALQSGCEAAESAATVRYIGTPEGLATLILDVYACEAADAVRLWPLDLDADAGESQNLILNRVLPRIRRHATAA